MQDHQNLTAFDRQNIQIASDHVKEHIKTASSPSVGESGPSRVKLHWHQSQVPGPQR
jgi:hypothetical protein